MQFPSYIWLSLYFTSLCLPVSAGSFQAGPFDLQLHVVDLQTSLHWKMDLGINSTQAKYEVQTCSQYDEGKCFPLDCKLKQNGNWISCVDAEDAVWPSFCGKLRVRAMYLNETAGPCKDCISCHCTDYHSTKEFCADKYSEYSKPEIKDVKTGHNSSRLSLDVPSNKVSCFFLYANFLFDVFVADLQDYSDDTCASAPPPSSIIDKELRTYHSNITDRVECSDGKAYIEIDDLRPDSDYCVFGHYTIDESGFVNSTSDTGYIRVKTTKVPAKIDDEQNLFIIVLAGFLLMALIVASVICACKKYKPFLKKISIIIPVMELEKEVQPPCVLHEENPVDEVEQPPDILIKLPEVSETFPTRNENSRIEQNIQQTPDRIELHLPEVMTDVMLNHDQLPEHSTNGKTTYDEKVSSNDWGQSNDSQKTSFNYAKKMESVYSDSEACEKETSGLLGEEIGVYIRKPNPVLDTPLNEVNSVEFYPAPTGVYTFKTTCSIANV
ncbi:uncharacterized protein LOC143468925 [Clavelina lepadiformis]|uniref:uncharacterized protein LOC143468925 n=1 Tax=Clavelina lepadiformis TaxID=159417 RepID=UPI00404238E2